MKLFCYYCSNHHTYYMSIYFARNSKGRPIFMSSHFCSLQLTDIYLCHFKKLSQYTFLILPSLLQVLIFFFIIKSCWIFVSSIKSLNIQNALVDINHCLIVAIWRIIVTNWAFICASNDSYSLVMFASFLRDTNCLVHFFFVSTICLFLVERLLFYWTSWSPYLTIIPWL